MYRWLALVVLLVGCAALPPVEHGEGRLPDDLAAFTLEGKVAWRHPEGRGNANLSWAQDDEAFALLLTGPLGHGAVRIEGDGEWVRLESSEGVRHAPRADDLLAETLGFPVPVSQVRWWVLGLPAPPAEGNGPVRVHERDAHGRPDLITQDAWRIRWADRRLVADYALPRRVEISRDDVSLILVVGAWSLPEVN